MSIGVAGKEMALKINKRLIIPIVTNINEINKTN